MAKSKFIKPPVMVLMRKYINQLYFQSGGGYRDLCGSENSIFDSSDKTLTISR